MAKTKANTPASKKLASRVKSRAKPKAIAPTATPKAKAVHAEIVEPGEERDDASFNSSMIDDFPDRNSLGGLDKDLDLDLPLDLGFDADLGDTTIPVSEAVIVNRLDSVDQTASQFSQSDEPSEQNESKALATVNDPVAVYLAEIRRYPLLTREQEQELAVRYRETGDPRAAEMLVTSNLRFVVKIAAEYSRFGAKLIDLVQEGNVGLMHAVKEFNPYKGVRLITYAVWWIRGYIQEYLMRQYSMVRIGTTQNQRKLFYRLQKERQSLQAAGQEPSYALLAGRLGVSEEEVETMSKRLSGRDVSLSTPVDGGNSAASLLDFESTNEEGVDDQIGHMEEMNVLLKNIEKIRPTLNEKETFILENRLLSDEPLTLQEIGDHYHVTREAVRQIEARLIGKLRSAVTTSLANPDEIEES